MHAAPAQKLVPLDGRARQAHADRLAQPRTSRSPSSPACACSTTFPLATLREYIDWTPFFHTWELKGVYPRILEHEKYGEQARKLFAERRRCSTRSSRRSCSRARGVYGFFPANAVGDDVELYTDETAHEVLDALPLPAPADEQGDGEPCRSLADFVAPKETGLRDHLGAFRGHDRHRPQGAVRRASRPQHDDYNAIMAEALADRLAEAFAEYLHKRVRDEWGYGADEDLSNDELIDEKYRGIRPAAGYPACPDHTEKGTLWRLLDVEKNTGMQLTESFAMWPGSSVSGLYFAHPESRYFGLGKIDRDQVDDYHHAQGHDASPRSSAGSAEPQLRARASLGLVSLSLPGGNVGPCSALERRVASSRSSAEMRDGTS